MPRPLDFDKETVLVAATDLIWTRGYNATSLSDLTEAMGLSRSSVYNTFGSKQEVLLAAIGSYSAARAREFARLLAKPRFRAGVDTLIETIIVDNNQGRGCLLINCATEVALHDARAATAVREGFNDLTHAIAMRAHQAREDGELAADADPDVLARSLITVIIGLRVMAKAGMDRRALRATARQALDRLLD